MGASVPDGSSTFDPQHALGGVARPSLARAAHLGGRRLDGTALHVWELLAQCTNLGELIDTLAAEYEVQRSECAPDIVPCLEGLLRQDLLVLD